MIILNICFSANSVIQRLGNFNYSLLSKERALNILKEHNSKAVRVLLSCEDNRVVKTFPNPYKVLLITSFGTVSGEPMRMQVPNMGLLSIYNDLNKLLEIDCQYIDPNISGKDRLYQLIKEEHFDIIGFSLLNATFHNDIELISKAKMLNKNAKIVVGGLTINTFKNDIMQYLPIDHIIRENGTVGIKKIIKTVSSGEEMNEVSNVKSHLNYFYEERTKDTVNSRNYNKSSSSDYLPYNCAGSRPLRIRMSEFCTGRCTYCNIPKRKNSIIPVSDIINIINQHKKTFDYIEFEDHEFTYKNSLARYVCDSIIKEGLEKIPKQCCTRVDSINLDILFLMRKAGFKIINYGIESFNQEILDFFGKDVSVKHNIDILEDTLSSGIKPGINLILFSPLESESSISETVKNATYFAEKGSTLNAVLKVTVSYGDRANKIASHKPHIESQRFFFPGMLQELILPKSLRLKKSIEPLYNQVLEMSAKMSSSFFFEYKRNPSVALNSFFFLLSIARIIDLPEATKLDAIVKKVIYAENGKKIWITI